MTVSSASPLWRTISAYSRCSSARASVQEQPAHADDGVHRRADLVAHGRQEGALGLVGRLGLPAGAEEVGDVVVDPDHAHLGAVDDDGHRRDLDVHQGAVLPGAPADRADPFAVERPAGRWRAPPRGPPASPRGPPWGGRGPPPPCTEEPLGAGVPAHDPAVEVHGHDRHRARLHDRVGVLLLALDLPEEPRVVDGQDRLGREGLERRDHLGREGGQLAPHDDEAAEQPVLPDERHREERARALPGVERPHVGRDELPLRPGCR